MSILQDLTSKDSTRIWSGASRIRTLRDRDELLFLASHLDEIRKATHDVDLGGILRPNSTHLGFSLRKLEFVRDSDACLCALYEMDDLYDPETEQNSGQIRILGTTLSDDGYVDCHECECTTCGTVFRVQARQYHYTWWIWTRA